VGTLSATACGPLQDAERLPVGVRGLCPRTFRAKAPYQLPRESAASDRNGSIMRLGGAFYPNFVPKRCPATCTWPGSFSATKPARWSALCWHRPT